MSSIPSTGSKPKKPMPRYWAALKEHAKGPHGRSWLFWISFVEALLLPVPTEPFLATAVAADRDRWVRLAAITTFASVLGASVSYLIGFFAFGLVEPFLMHVHDFSRVLLFVAEQADRHAFLISFAASFSFIPFTPLILLMGFFGVDPLVFLSASVLGRGARFIVTAYLVRTHGEETVTSKERGLAIFAGVFLIALLAWGTLAFTDHPLLAPGHTGEFRAQYGAILRVLHERHILPVAP